MQGSDLAHMKTDWYLYCPHLCLLVISSELCGSAFTFFLCFLVGFLINDGRVETVAKIIGQFPSIALLFRDSLVSQLQ